jgi:hypothetical protein
VLIGDLHLDGQITANGEEGKAVYVGGGSGGSIWIYTNLIRGYGRIAADGGDGFTHGTYPAAGGGGGRVALYFQVHKHSSIFYNSLIN